LWGLARPEAVFLIVWSDTDELRALRAAGTISDITLVWSSQNPGKIYGYAELMKVLGEEKGGDEPTASFVPTSELGGRAVRREPWAEFFSPRPLHRWIQEPD
jgi:hypothetical protein